MSTDHQHVCDAFDCSSGPHSLLSSQGQLREQCDAEDATGRYCAAPINHEGYHVNGRGRWPDTSDACCAGLGDVREFWHEAHTAATRPDNHEVFDLVEELGDA